MRSTRLGWTLAAVLLALAGCSSTIAGSAAPEGAGSAAATEIASAEQEAGGAPAAGAVDACALLSAADVEPVVGKGVSPEPHSAGGDGGQCTWENKDDYHSVTLEVGRSGSAPGGQLPPWDDTLGPERALPDGMREIVSGQVEFVGGGRDCVLQVATTAPGDADREKAVELARKVRGQL
jgi:uncharacterized protein YceK